jgi:tetratricopeptide (TPR) repeat protein
MNSKIYYSRLILITLLLQAAFILSAQSDRKYIRQGNGKYSDGKFPEAEILYRRALNDNKTSANAGFNVGDALYKQNKFDEAAKQFQGTAGAMTDVSKKSDSHYNLGNSLLKANKFEEAISAYKNSLRLVPGRNDARYNLAYAQDQLKDQQENKEKQKDQDQDNNKDKDQNKDNNKDQGKDQQKKDNDQQPQQQQDKSQDQQQQKEGYISKEDAQRLLDALANDEKNVQEKVKEAKAAKARVKTLINW